jgi:hypothetical protein
MTHYRITMDGLPPSEEVMVEAFARIDRHDFEIPEGLDVYDFARLAATVCTAFNAESPDGLRELGQLGRYMHSYGFRLEVVGDE